MSGKFYPLEIEKIFKMIFFELNKRESIFGIDKSLFFYPTKNSKKLCMDRYGDTMETPLGVAAGPQTQMAQNIITAWLTGSRYMELKTVQTLDELEISKPCIDAEDEGFNCEWSQELNLEQSYHEYLKAFILIHILQDYLQHPISKSLGTIFNMSVGYDFQGIQKANVQKFFSKMKNAKKEKDVYLKRLLPFYPRLKDIHIPDLVSNNITLSTMHGCPSDEIEKIGKYLIEGLGLHTTIKLNPTLNGKEEVRQILNRDLGYHNIVVPDLAFEHDLKFHEAKTIIKNLKQAAMNKGVGFSIKLTNTLECENNKEYFDPQNSKHMYMSGRALHVLAINLACKLQDEFKGALDLSFCAGVDALNVSDVLSLNIKPVTVCTDLLKPGGYGKTYQYIENINQKMKDLCASNLEELVLKTACENDLKKAALINLFKYRDQLRNNKRYIKSSFPYKNIKGSRPLTMVDCIEAPCSETCKANQNVPEYMRKTVSGEFDKGLQEIMKTNPLPNITGLACDHKCEDRCTRINYDNPLHIREIKRFLASNAIITKVPNEQKKLKKVAIIGGGPCGLSAAHYLRKVGFRVEIFESREIVGGMVTNILPNFRTIKDQVNFDIDKIKELGVIVHTGTSIDSDSALNEIIADFNYVILSIGSPEAKSLGVDNEEMGGVINFLDFLEKVKKGKINQLPKKVAVIGGGNSAIDAARTAKRLMNKDDTLFLIYRRTWQDMPADREEIQELLDEKITVLELTSPKKIIINNDTKNIAGLTCIKTEIAGVDSQGRNKIKEIPGSEFTLEMDLIISAIGQEKLNGKNFKSLEKEADGTLKYFKENLETSIKNVFIGGDSARGPQSIIQAIADGRKIVEQICYRENCEFLENRILSSVDLREIRKKRVQKNYGKGPRKLDPLDRDNFETVVETLSQKEATIEAKRCLNCDLLCEVCVTVCPNRANVSYQLLKKDYHLKDIIIDQMKHSLGVDYIFSITQENQVFNIGDFCNECGNCNTFCPASGRPYQDKPKIYLSRKSFKETGANAFYFEEEKSARTLFVKTSCENYKIVYPYQGDLFFVENNTIKMQLLKDNLKVKTVDLIKRNGHVNMLEVAIMKELIVNLKMD
ncbi:MAG: putative selenate reductase subunit YgfK [Bdellovibrionales bacterium RIFOXYA1_FULL_36_14]|nr:MAG: putative selenate reductase subunit YgfK [Bdellovibrionales bacterium RIFOXYA1_FULL_36_14]